MDEKPIANIEFPLSCVSEVEERRRAGRRRMYPNWKAMSGWVGACLFAISLPGCNPDAPVTIVSTNCNGTDSSFTLPAHAMSAERVFLFAGDTAKNFDFGRIQDLVVDENGRIYVLDDMNQRVSVHLPDGRILHVFGRKGEGPGEFSHPTTLYLTASDTIKVFDGSLFRVTSFSKSGDLFGTLSPPSEPQFGQDEEVRFAGDGALYKLSYEGYQESLLSALGTRASGIVRGRNTIKRWHPGADQWTDLIIVPGLEVYVDLGEGAIRDVPLAKRPLWTVSAGALWHADNSQYELRKHTRDGKELCEIRAAWDRVETTRKERQDFYSAEEVANDPRFSEQNVNRIRKEREDIAYPELKPALRSFLVAENGDLWIDPIQHSTSNPLKTWHVLSSTGTPRASVDLPRRFHPMFIIEDRVYGRELGDLDAHQVALYRLLENAE